MKEFADSSFPDSRRQRNWWLIFISTAVDMHSDDLFLVRRLSGWKLTIFLFPTAVELKFNGFFCCRRQKTRFLMIFFIADGCRSENWRFILLSTAVELHFNRFLSCITRCRKFILRSLKRYLRTSHCNKRRGEAKKSRFKNEAAFLYSSNNFYSSPSSSGFE